MNQVMLQCTPIMYWEELLLFHEQELQLWRHIGERVENLESAVDIVTSISRYN